MGELPALDVFNNFFFTFSSSACFLPLYSEVDFDLILPFADETCSDGDLSLLTRFLIPLYWIGPEYTVTLYAMLLL